MENIAGGPPQVQISHCGAALALAASQSQSGPAPSLHAEAALLLIPFQSTTIIPSHPISIQHFTLQNHNLARHLPRLMILFATRNKPPIFAPLPTPNLPILHSSPWTGRGSVRGGHHLDYRCPRNRFFRRQSKPHRARARQVHVNAIGLATLCLPSDHTSRPKPAVPDGCDLDVNLTV